MTLTFYISRRIVVEYDCNEKYLKGLLIRKGLWKVTTYENKARDSSLAYLGPPIFLSRVDVEGERNTPSRSNLTKVRPRESFFRLLDHSTHLLAF